MMDQKKNLWSVLEDKVVLVTGGTGSFGWAFIESALEGSGARKLIVLSRDEQKHYRMEQEMRDRRLRFFVGDIRDRDRLRTAFREVDVLIHAAAMKHVPICEYNPIEAVRTNIEGAKNIIEAALEAGIPKVLALSTDKAVSPVNLYGATKLCMEKLLIAANSYSGSIKTKFSAVRYGNVMGSAGSVIPLFKRQKAEGLITITDDRMTRFWISMNGAITLVLQALNLMEGGEIFVPKLPTSDINTLAEALAPGVPRKVVGIRPGEKVHEMLISPEEARRTRDLGDLFVILPDFAHWSPPRTSVGNPVDANFVYTSDRPDLRLSLAATCDLLARL